jgi:hypothetical protein
MFAYSLWGLWLEHTLALAVSSIQSSQSICPEKVLTVIKSQPLATSPWRQWLWIQINLSEFIEEAGRNLSKRRP